MVEPWLRGTLQEVEPVRRAVLHALELGVVHQEVVDIKPCSADGCLLF
jgi:hypothetical protein